MVEWTISEGRRLLSDIVDLAAEFSWLYDFQGTQILRCGVLNAVPLDWRTTLAGLDNSQLNGLALCEPQSGYPLSLKRFLERCRQLSIHNLLPDTDKEEHQHPSLATDAARGICPKKRHEVVRLSTLVKEVTGRCGARAVLDIGAGLGYVDSLLHHQLGLRVMAAESEAFRVTQARARHVKLCGRECSALQFVTWQLRDNKETVQKAGSVVEQLAAGALEGACGCQDSAKLSRSGRIVENIMATAPGKEVEESHACAASQKSCVDSRDFNNITESSYLSSSSLDPTAAKSSGTVLLLGLHSCADLSPLMIRIFMCCSKISSLVLLSCCYHKMKTIKSTGAHEQTDEDLFEHITIDDEEMEEERGDEDEEATLASEPDDTRMSETSEGYESDVSYETLTPAKPCKTHQKNVPGPFATPRRRPEVAASSSGAPAPHRGSTPRQRRSSPDSECLFQNFPLSRTLSVLMCRRGFSLSGYGLRLACQEPGLRWRDMSADEHRRHENAMLFRGVLDNVCSEGGVVLTKQKRRCANKEQFTSFESYLTSVVDGYTASFKSGVYCDAHANLPPSSSQSFQQPLFHSTSSSHSVNPVEGSSFPLHQKEDLSSTLLCPSVNSVLVRHSIDNILISNRKTTSQEASSLENRTTEPSGGCGTTYCQESTASSSKPYSPSASQQQPCSMHCLAPALRACHDQHLHLAPLLEAVTGLQLAMQGVLEALVLLDRVLYALESQFCSSVQLVKVFDAALSPRCVAMVLYK